MAGQTGKSTKDICVDWLNLRLAWGNFFAEGWASLIGVNVSVIQYILDGNGRAGDLQSPQISALAGVISESMEENWPLSNIEQVINGAMGSDVGALTLAKVEADLALE